MENVIRVKHTGGGLVLLLLLALALRLIFVFFPRTPSLFEGEEVTDMSDYHNLACNFLSSGTFGPAVRPPLYPLFLATVYRVAGQSQTSVRFTHAILGTLACLFTYLISLRLWGARAARLSALLVACYPSLIVYTGLLMSENLFIFLLAAALYLLMPEGRHRRAACLSAGLILGLASLTRSVLIGFIPLVVLWLLARREGRAACLCLFGWLLVISPWTLRNCSYYHRFVLIDTYGDYNFLIGNNPDAKGCQDLAVMKKLASTYWPIWSGDNRERPALGYREGLRFIVTHPARFLRLGIKKMGYLYGPEIRDLSWGYSKNYFGGVPRPLLVPSAAAVIAAFPLIAVLAIFGVCLRGVGPGGWRGAGGLLILAVFYFSVAHFLTFGESRFHLPLVPIFAVFAGSLARRDEKPVMESPHAGRVAARIIVSAVLLTLLSLNWAVRLGEDWVRLGRVLGPGGNTASLDY